MKCPHCQTSDLKPTMIEEYLPAMGCGTCRGSLVSLLYYRHWVETQKAPANEPRNGVAAVETTDTTTAIRCPKCARLMTKYKLTGSVSNRVDVCATCDEAWLDGGEWELLEALQLSLKMPAIFTDAPLDPGAADRRGRHRAGRGIPQLAREQRAQVSHHDVSLPRLSAALGEPVAGDQGLHVVDLAGAHALDEDRRRG